MRGRARNDLGNRLPQPIEIGILSDPSRTHMFGHNGNVVRPRRSGIAYPISPMPYRMADTPSGCPFQPLTCTA